jgi:psiF repeat
MKKLIALAALGAFVAGAQPAFAAEHSQQTRMKDCNVKAKGKKGDERRQFMSSCLSGKDAAKDVAKDAAVKKVSVQKKPL